MPRRLRLSGDLVVLLAKDYDRLCAELNRLREMERAILVRRKPPVAKPFLDRERAPTEEME